MSWLVEVWRGYRLNRGPSLYCRCGRRWPHKRPCQPGTATTL